MNKYLLMLCLGVVCVTPMATSAQTVAVTEVATAVRPTLKPFKAHYRLFAAGSERGDAQITLRENGDGSMTFALTAQINKGLLSLAGASTEMSTRFTPQADHLRLLNYHLSLKHLAGSKGFDTVYLHDQGIAKSTGDVKKHHSDTVRFPPKASNPNVISLNLGLDWLQHGDGQHAFTYDLVDRGRLKQETYAFFLPETLELPIGTMQAVKVVSDEPEGNEDFVWYSKKYGYIPVRLMQMRGGKVEMDIQLIRVDG